MHVDIIDSFETLTALKPNWEAVYDADPEAHYFLSWTWISNWFENLSCPWLVLAAKASPDASNYVAFFPLQLRTEIAQDGTYFNSIRMGGSHFAVYTGLICDPASQDGAIPAFANCLKAVNWTSLHLDDIYVSDKRRSLLFNRFPQTEFVTQKVRRASHITDVGEDIDHDIYIYVKLPGDWETYLNTLGTNTRRDARYFLRKVDGSGEYRITHADAETIERDLETLLGFWLAQWEEKNPRYAHGIVQNSRRMLMRCFEAGALFLPVLWKGDTPIGAHVCFADRSKQALVCFLVSRDLSIKKPPPGFVLHVHSIQWAIENGFKLYDLGTGNFSYKNSFGSDEHRVVRWRIGTRTNRNLRGTLEPRSLPVLIDHASRLHRGGKLAEAETACRQILHADSQHAGALELLREIEAARAALPQADFATAFDLHKRGQTEEARRIYSTILASEPRHFDARHLLGVTFLERGQFETAEQQIGLAIEIDPNVAAAHNNRGNALKSLGRFDEALASYERAIALKPDYAMAYNNRGNVLRALRRTEEALASYETAMALAPDYTVARDNHAKVLKELGRDR